MTRWIDEEESETIPCPHCRKQIHKITALPFTANAIFGTRMRRQTGSRGGSFWGVLACLYVAYRWITG